MLESVFLIGELVKKAELEMLENGKIIDPLDIVPNPLCEIVSKVIKVND